MANNQDLMRDEWLAALNDVTPQLSQQQIAAAGNRPGSPASSVISGSMSSWVPVVTSTRSIVGNAADPYPAVVQDKNFLNTSLYGPVEHSINTPPLTGRTSRPNTPEYVRVLRNEMQAEAQRYRTHLVEETQTVLNMQQELERNKQHLLHDAHNIAVDRQALADEAHNVSGPGPKTKKE